VTSDETPPELTAQADLLVDGPTGVRALLEALARSSGAVRRSAQDDGGGDCSAAGAATNARRLTVAAAVVDRRCELVFVAAGWCWPSALIGASSGPPRPVSPADRQGPRRRQGATMMPEHRPGAVHREPSVAAVLSTIAAGILGIVAPQIPAIATGFAIIWAWAGGETRAGLAIEERDGVSNFSSRPPRPSPIKLRARSRPAPRR